MHEEINSPQILERKEKRHLLLSIIGINIFLLLVILTFASLQSDVPVQNPASLYIIIALFFSSFVSVFFFDSLKWTARLLSLIYFVFIPLRVYFSGGINSEVIYIYLGHITLAYAYYGKTVGRIVLAVSFTSVCLFFLIDAPTSALNDYPFLAIVKFLTMAIVLIPIFVLVEQTKILQDKYLDMERKNARNIILHRLHHEIGNKLNIAMGTVELEMEERESEGALQSVEDSLISILEVTRTLEQAQGEMDIVAFLSSRSKKTKIIEEIMDERGS